MIGKRRPFARKAAFFCPAGDKTLRPSEFFSRSFLARTRPEPERSAVPVAESPCFMPSRIRQRTPEQEPSVKRRARVSAMNGGLFSCKTPRPARPVRPRTALSLVTPAAGFFPCGCSPGFLAAIFPRKFLPQSFSPRLPPTAPRPRTALLAPHRRLFPLSRVSRFRSGSSTAPRGSSASSPASAVFLRGLFLSHSAKEILQRFFCGGRLAGRQRFPQFPPPSLAFPRVPPPVLRLSS